MDKFDLFATIKLLNTSTLGVFNSVPGDEKTKVSPFLLMKYLSGVSDRKQVLMLAQYVNPIIFSCKDKEFLLDIMAATTSGKNTNVKWPGVMKLASSKYDVVIAKYFDCSVREAKTMTGFYAKDEIIGMAEELGYDDDALKQLKKD